VLPEVSDSDPWSVVYVYFTCGRDNGRPGVLLQLTRRTRTHVDSAVYFPDKYVVKASLRLVPKDVQPLAIISPGAPILQGAFSKEVRVGTEVINVEVQRDRASSDGRMFILDINLSSSQQSPYMSDQGITFVKRSRSPPRGFLTQRLSILRSDGRKSES
jgi:hypothetical protein